MKMKNDVKFEEELTCHFKIEMKNLTSFDRALKNLKKLLFNGLLRTKVVGNLLAKTRGSRFESCCYLCAEVSSLQ